MKANSLSLAKYRRATAGKEQEETEKKIAIIKEELASSMDETVVVGQEESQLEKLPKIA
jgi:hypothetical protein